MCSSDLYFYSVSYGNVLPDGLCDEGYYCPGEDNSSAPASTICPQGIYNLYFSYSFISLITSFLHI